MVKPPNGLIVNLRLKLFPSKNKPKNIADHTAEIKEKMKVAFVVFISVLVAVVSYWFYTHANQAHIDLRLPLNTRIEWKKGENTNNGGDSGGDDGGGGWFQFKRLESSGMILHIDASDELSYARALGIAHAHDRYAQMFTIRLIAQGRLSECMASDEQSLAIDRIMRQMSFAQSAKLNVHRLEPRVRQLVQVYTDGINEYIERNERPLEFILAGYEPEPWTVEDSLMLASLVGFANLASAQLDQEKFIIMALKSGNEQVVQLVKRLYAPHLDNVHEFVSPDILQQVSIEVPLIQEHVAIFKKFVPQFIGSNNWVVSGKKSVSGKPMMAFDPHLDVSRIPGFWYEISARIENIDTNLTGVTVPGLPGTIMGRSNSVVSSFTYGFMDLFDYFIEDCKDMKCRDGNEYVPVQKTVSTIKRKGTSDVEVVLFRTRNGILELRNSSSHTFPDGFYLSRSFTHERGPGGVGTLSTIALAHDVKSIDDFMVVSANSCTSTNLLLADDQGNIAYSQAGLAPIRAGSGLFPVLGWNEDHQWKGFIPGTELKKVINPEESFIATANDNHNGHHMVVNTHMGNYRANRIRQLLASKEKFSVQDFKEMQSDRTSLQADAFMRYLRPILDKQTDSLSKVLSEWDLKYEEKSRGAYLFEMFYKELLSTVYGSIVGREFWSELRNTAVYFEFFHYFDALLLEQNPTVSDVTLIWQSKTREQLFEQVWLAVRDQLEKEQKTMVEYGEYHQYTVWNLFYRAILPDSVGLLLGIHQGPFPFLGSRATIQQAQLITQKPLDTTFGVSYRCVSDMGEQKVHTTYPGGISDNILSSLYSNRLQSYLRNEYIKTEL